MVPTLLILAAGIGSRYGGLKQADGVGPSGEAILDYSIYDAIRAGFQKIVFVIRKDIEEDMKRVFFDKWEGKVLVETVFQEMDKLPGGYKCPEGRTKPWGTGHAIWVARETIREPFGVINADDFYGRHSYQLAKSFLGEMENLLDSRYCLIGYVLKNTLSDHGFVSRAECRTDEKGQLVSIIERLKIKRDGYRIIYQGNAEEELVLDENTIVSMNIWGFMPSLFEHLEQEMILFLEKNSQSISAEFLLPDVIDKLIKSGMVEIPVLRTEAQWFGMTYREDREAVSAKLKALVDAGVYPSPIWDF
jgi:UTP-glucose-1-phosphate uridylyltransferase